MIYLRMYDIPVRKPFTYQRGNLDMDGPSPLTSYQTPGPPAVDPPSRAGIYGCFSPPTMVFHVPMVLYK